MIRQHLDRSQSSERERRIFTTRLQAALHAGGRRRLLGAFLCALLALALLIWLGPDQESVRQRFEYYGAPNELRIMPDISIEEGQDRAYQLPKSLQAPPPPSRIEIEPEDLDDRAAEKVSAPQEEPNVKDVDSERQWDEADVAADERVQLALPMQSNPDFYIIYQEWPEYPAEAPEYERRTPVIFVKAAVFVNADGLVSDAMVTSTNGSRVYSEAVLKAIRTWKFGWRIDPGAGRWIEIPINFRSPYFSPGLPGTDSP